MNVFNRVALNTLIKNKTRTTVTIIGIILSAAMICAVTTFASSIYNYALKNAVYTYGDWHGAALNGNTEVYEEINSSGKVKEAVYARQIGYAVAEGCQNVDKPYIYILAASENFEEMMSVHITSGRYPGNSGEIMLPAHLAENGGVIYHLGDTLTLDVGQRVSDGYTFWQHNPYSYENVDDRLIPYEELVTEKTLTYTVVGFYERPTFEPYTAPGYTAVTLEGKGDNDSLYSVWYKMKNPRNAYDFSLNEVFGFSQNASSLCAETNDSVLNYSGATGYDTMDFTITAMAAIVIGLIMFGSISLIYNAFSISVSERTKQFGLLASVGATRKQLRQMVLFEALAVGAVGIPVGVLAGIGGIGVTLLIIGHRFETFLNYPIPLRVSVSTVSVIIAVIVSIVTVLISAWIPSKRATRVSAVEAIRQNRDISASDSGLKTSKLVYRLFGLPGMLANKHYKRSRRKYRSTVISLFMSIVLFVSASAFTNYLTEAYEGITPSGYDIVYYHAPYENTITDEELLDEFIADEAVTDVACVVSNIENIEIEKKYLSEHAFSERYGLIREETEDRAAVFSEIMFVDEASYQELVKENGLSREYLEADIPKAIVIDSIRSFDVETEKYELIDFLGKENIKASVSAPKPIEGYDYPGTMNDNGKEWLVYTKEDGSGEQLQIPLSEGLVEVPLILGDSIDKHPFYASFGIQLIYPISAMEHMFPGDWQGSSNSGFDTDFFFTSSDHQKSFEAIKATVSENGMPSSRVYDYAADDEEKNNAVVVIRVFSYGFIALISLIASANVFNTISTNISLRRREFAMLKSVGMTAKGFNKMMNFECLLYGTKALLYGLPASVAVTYLIHLAVNESFRTEFHLPVTAILISVFSVFAVVFVTMMYSMSKIRKENPIDALKNENL